MDLRHLLEQKKVPELRKIARTLEVAGRSRMKKPDFIDALLACEGIASAIEQPNEPAEPVALPEPNEEPKHQNRWLEWGRWWIWEFPGFRAIWEHVRPPEKKAPTIMIWLAGLYTALFGITSGIYENRADRIELRARTVISQMSSEDARPIACGQIAAIQRMPIPIKPEFKKPWKVIQSLYDTGRYQPGVELLRDTVVTWKKKLRGANLRNADLQGADLEYADLQGADLEYADLQGADLTVTELKGAKLFGAKLQGAYLGIANLQGAFLKRAKLQGADVWETDLRGANLTEADLRGANLTEADLQGADLKYADLQGADLEYADLQGADLKYADLQGADLFDVDLTNCVNLTISQLQDVCIYQSTKLPHYLWDQEHEREILANLILIDHYWVDRD